MEWIENAENVTLSNVDANGKCLIIICVKAYNCRVNYPDPCKTKAYPFKD